MEPGVVKEGRPILCVLNVSVNSTSYHSICCVLDGFHAEETIYTLLFLKLKFILQQILKYIHSFTIF